MALKQVLEASTVNEFLMCIKCKKLYFSVWLIFYMTFESNITSRCLNSLTFFIINLNIWKNHIVLRV